MIVNEDKTEYLTYCLVTIATSIQYLLAEIVCCGRVIGIYWSTEAARATGAHNLSNSSCVAHTIHWLDTGGI